MRPDLEEQEEDHTSEEWPLLTDPPPRASRDPQVPEWSLEESGQALCHQYYSCIKTRRYAF